VRVDCATGSTTEFVIRVASRRQSFERFVGEHGDALVFFAYMVCGDRERGEDATQEALARVYRRWRHLEDPLAYARLAIVNATRDAWRRGMRQERAVTALAAEPVRAPVGAEELVMQRDRLRRALDLLPARQRAVIVLRYWSGLTEAETARSLDVTVGTVKQHATRALARMREELERDAVDSVARIEEKP
jgi:RNA polymerase sigma-70 factor (sigma-E family)